MLIYIENDNAHQVITEEQQIADVVAADQRHLKMNCIPSIFYSKKKGIFFHVCFPQHQPHIHPLYSNQRGDKKSDC
jgi:hypothetical protein